MTGSRIALVTGANQGLGRALVEALAARMAPQDRVLLTGRDPRRVQAAAAAVADGQAIARVEGRVLDVRDGDAIADLAAELGEVDIVFSNATSRMSPHDDPADQVDAVAQTSNLATTRMLRAFAPRLRRGGRLIIVASALGTLDKLDDRVARRFAAAAENLDAVDALVAEWRQAVHDGRAEDEGYGTWLNIPSKVAQVAAVRAIARERRTADLADDKLIMALCPGLIDTDASRPWFADMSEAQTPAEAASWPVELALGSSFDAAFYGELVQFGQVLPWESGIPVPHTATTRRCDRKHQRPAVRPLRTDASRLGTPSARRFRLSLPRGSGTPGRGVLRTAIGALVRVALIGATGKLTIVAPRLRLVDAEPRAQACLAVGLSRGIPCGRARLARRGSRWSLGLRGCVGRIVSCK